MGKIGYYQNIYLRMQKKKKKEDNRPKKTKNNFHVTIQQGKKTKTNEENKNEFSGKKIKYFILNKKRKQKTHCYDIIFSHV